MSEVLSKLWRAVRYLFAPGNVLYWGMYALAGMWLGWHQLKQAEAVRAFLRNNANAAQLEAGDLELLLAMQSKVPVLPLSAVLIMFVAMLLLVAKMCDGVQRIGEGLGDEPVPFTPVSIVPFSIVFKYFFGMFLWALPWGFLIVTMRFAVWALVATVVFYIVFAPAMLMNLIGNNSLRSMISPQSWVVTITNLRWRYVAIIVMPVLLAVAVGFVAGLLAALLGSVMFELVAESVLTAFFFALPWAYCGYFMRADAAEETLTAPMHAVLAEADVGMMSDAEQRAFAQDMLTVDMLMEEGAGGIEEILAPYVARDAGMWFPAFARQYALLQRRGGRDALRQFEDRLLARAASGDMHNGEMRLYTLLRHALLRIAEDDPARLHGDWIAALSQLANAHGDHDMVLHLTHGFHQRHPEHKDTVGNYYLRARALDRLGRREESVKLLTQLLAHYPDHPRAAQIRRTLTLLQKPS